MLQALELNGFKSFADRTRFEFPTGITVVVGPNGSGKSNVVDAIKWVLGTQSAKALRGKEMTDVIFSGTRGRRQTGAAEVSLIFDNTDRVLDYDAPEVQVTRRVYRSGEGEYLINRQPCRLRDIRDLFSGTGVASGAYSIIEQGKVDAVLQSTPQQRRLIFEEAAGVSRFKQKRIESARRLERVEQNLLRLSDIVDELGSRLRSVRSQAGKAQKYKEHSDRLRELRTQVGLVDWRELSDKLAKISQRDAAAQTTCQSLEARLAEYETNLKQAENQADSLQQQNQEATAKASEVRQRIAQCESTRSSQLARSDELLQESERLERQLLTMTSRVGDSQQLVAETSAELELAERQHGEQQGRLQQQQTELQHDKQQLAEARSRVEAWRSQHTDAVRNAALLDHRIEVLKSQQTSAQASADRCREQTEELAQSRRTYAEQLKSAQSDVKRLTLTSEQSAQNLELSQQQLRQARSQLAATQKQLADLQGRLTGARERAIVLEELERRLDGLSAGVKEVLRLAGEEPDGPFGEVRGVVADLLHVDVDTASLVEIALGDRANQLVVSQTSGLLNHLLTDASQLAGRAGFLRLDVPAPASAVDRVDLSAESGVMGRADQFVETASDLATLTRRLLGRFWFVDTLATAVRLAGGMGRGLNFVTVAGEVLQADGTLLVGPRQAATGLLSRRSELRALQDEIEEMNRSHATHHTHCQELETAITRGEQVTQQLASQHAHLTKQLGEARLQTSSAQDRLDPCLRQLEEVSTSRDEAIAQSKSAEIASENTKNDLRQCQASLAQLENSLVAGAQQLAELERQIATLQRAAADERVALARSEQRRDGLRRQMDQLKCDYDERDRALADTRQRVDECHGQRNELQNSVLDLTTELAELYRTVETVTATIDQLQTRNHRLRLSRQKCLQSVEQLRSELLAQQQQLGQLQLQSQQLTQQKNTLAQRMQEDYQIDLSRAATQHTAAPAQHTAAQHTAAQHTAAQHTATLHPYARADTDQEINQLREQLQHIGPVNLEALSELEALEERYHSLSQQYDDLCQAKERLQQVIVQINTDSRELFVSTIEVIRGHFQELFRNLFAGGEADIVMDGGDEADVLECGIEIIARPPGKQPRSISLLSGGERTLTCVALLLAIFRSRPSPFCILDEVDAALDEANIDRFVEVIKQFMKSTQFIVVTHSKRTMACADTLYGITMQESGISKRVSVRFEDVGSDGHIRTLPTGGAAAA